MTCIGLPSAVRSGLKRTLKTRTLKTRPSEEDEDEVEDEEDDEDAVAAGQVAAVAVKKEAAPVKHLTTEEARMKVQGVVRNWLLETVGEKAAVKPG